jgi:hypothetical protein
VNDNNLEEFKTVNGQNLEEYEQCVTETYENAMFQFRGSRKTVITPIISRLDTSLSRLSHLCRKTEALVADPSCNSCMSQQLVQGLNIQLNPLMNEVQDLLGQMSAMQVSEQDFDFDKYKNTVEELLSRCDAVKLDCSIAIHRFQSSSTSLQFHVQSQPDKLNEASPIEERPKSNGGSIPVSGHAEGRGDIQIKKLSLPEFNGSRKE